MKKRMFFLVLTFLVLLSGTAYAGQWKQDYGRWSYQESDGEYVQDGWKQIEGEWFYFDKDGWTTPNTWLEIGGKWYYFDILSIMLHDTTTPDGYQVGSDGAWIMETGTPADISVWIGIYKSEDGQTITVKSADSNGINVAFNGYGEEGDYTQEYTLLFTGTDKKQAIYNESQVDQRDFYTLTEKGIEVTVEPAGGWKQGTYVKQ